jgi:hypothetical protein
VSRFGQLTVEPVYNSRSTGSPVSSYAWRGNGVYPADPLVNHSVNGHPSSGVDSAASSNPYDLLYEQDEVEIDDGEV